MLLEHKTSLAWMSCEKASPLHIAASLCALPARRQQGLEAAKLLLSANASVFDTLAPVFLHMASILLPCAADMGAVSKVFSALGVAAGPCIEGSSWQAHGLESHEEPPTYFSHAGMRAKGSLCTGQLQAAMHILSACCLKPQRRRKRRLKQLLKRLM